MPAALPQPSNAAHAPTAAHPARPHSRVCPGLPSSRAVARVTALVPTTLAPAAPAALAALGVTLVAALTDAAEERRRRQAARAAGDAAGNPAHEAAGAASACAVDGARRRHNLGTLLGACAPVASNGVPLTGRMYASLCAHLCEHGRAKMPMVRDTWTLLSAIQARDLKDALLAWFAQTLEAWKPADFAVLRAVAVNAVNELLSSFEAQISTKTRSER